MTNSKTLSISLAVSILIIIVLSLHIHKQNGYKQSVEELFGEDHYLIENIKDDDENRTRIYTRYNKHVDGYEVFKEYMHSIGYSNIPEKQNGLFYTFESINGQKAECESEPSNRGYIVWDVYWE